MFGSSRQLRAVSAARATGLFPSARPCTGVSRFGEVNNVAKLNKVWWSHPRQGWGGAAGYVGVLGAIALATGCGHYGVDLDGVTEDASVSETTTGEDKPTKPQKPTKTEEITSDTGDQTSPGRDASPGDSNDETKPSKTDDTNLTGGETNTLVSDVSGTHGGTPGGGTQTVDPDEPKDAGADASATRDASSDGSDNTGETKTDDETGVSDPAVDLDGGVPACDPVCACAQGLECNLLCGEGECLASCGASAQCEVVVGDAPVVEIECAAGAYCATSGISGLDVDVTCSGEGECHTECNDNQSCFVQCEGPGRCVSKCHGSGMCDVKCAEGVECYVVYDNLDHVALNCGDRAIKICDGIATCNELCP